jgi:hypothetical protein
VSGAGEEGLREVLDGLGRGYGGGFGWGVGWRQLVGITGEAKFHSLLRCALNRASNFIELISDACRNTVCEVSNLLLAQTGSLCRQSSGAQHTQANEKMLHNQNR